MSNYNVLAGGGGKSFPEAITVIVKAGGGGSGGAEAKRSGGLGAGGTKLTFNIDISPSDNIIIGVAGGGKGGATGSATLGGLGGTGLTGTGSLYNGGTGGISGNLGTSGSGGGGGGASAFLLNDILIAVASGGGGGGGAGLNSAGGNVTFGIESQTTVTQGGAGTSKATGLDGGGGGGGGAGKNGGAGGNVSPGDYGALGGQTGFNYIDDTKAYNYIKTLNTGFEPKTLGSLDGADGYIQIKYPIEFAPAVGITGTYTIDTITEPGTRIYTWTTPGTFSLSSTIIFFVGGATLTNTLSTPNISTFGENVLLSATLSNITATGYMIFKTGDIVLGYSAISNGIATLTTAELPVGVNNITATYSGDATYASVISNIRVMTTNKRATTVVNSTSLSSITIGTLVTFTATVSNAGSSIVFPTGEASFYDNGVLIGRSDFNGTKNTTTFSTSALAIGSHSITMGYAGDTNYLASNASSINVTVSKVSTTTGLISSTTTSPVGVAVTLTASVSKVSPGISAPILTGSFSFYDGATLLQTIAIASESISVPLITSTLSTGTHSITVAYSGDNNYIASTSSIVTVTVGKLVTSTTISANPSVASQGASITFSAAVVVSGSVPAGYSIVPGTVTFYNRTTGATLGTSTLANGIASISTTATATGTNNVYVIYNGDTNYLSSQSADISVTENKVPTTMGITSSSASVSAGSTITLTSTLVFQAISGVAGPTGLVTFYSGGTSLGTSTISAAGIATFNTVVSPAGTYSYSSSYAGDATYVGVNSSNPATVSVTATKVNISVFSITGTSPVAYGAATTITAALTPSVNLGAVGGSLTFFNRTTGANLGTVSVLNGAASISTSGFNVGVNQIYYTYSGDINYNSGTSSDLSITESKYTGHSIALSLSATSAAQGTNITITSSISSQTSPAPTGNIIIKRNGTQIGTDSAATGGSSRYGAALSPGTYSITADYAGDDNYTAKTSTTQTLIITATAGSYTDNATGSGTHTIPFFQTSVTIKIWGGGGAGGSSAVGAYSAGGAGGNSTVTINGVTSTANGGGGGPADNTAGGGGATNANGSGTTGISGAAGTAGSNSTGGDGGSAPSGGGAGGTGVVSSAENTVPTAGTAAGTPGGGGGGGAILWKTGGGLGGKKTRRLASGGGGSGGVVITQGGIGLRGTVVSYNIGAGGTTAYVSTGQRGAGGVGAPGGITISWT